MKVGNFRKVFYLGRYAIKLARGLSGIFANLSEFYIWISSCKKQRKFLAKTYFSCGFFNIQEKCFYASENKIHSFFYKTARDKSINPIISNDISKKNIGKSNITGRYVKIDYADHWMQGRIFYFFCKIFKKKCSGCKSKICIFSLDYRWRTQPKEVENEKTDKI